MKTCFFIGHHDAPESVQERLDMQVEYLVKMCGVTEFIVGYRGAFDRMATAAVQKVKRSHPEIYAYRLLCYHPYDCQVTVPEYFDNTFYPDVLHDVPRRFAIEKANRYALKESDYLVAYVRWLGGNSGRLLAHARRFERLGPLKVINLAESEPTQ